VEALRRLVLLMTRSCQEIQKINGAFPAGMRRPFLDKPQLFAELRGDEIIVWTSGFYAPMQSRPVNTNSCGRTGASLSRFGRWIGGVSGSGGEAPYPPVLSSVS
jgi:hypothetical protein